MDVPIAATTLGITGAVCWSVQLIPQIVINYRQHDTTGLQPTMMLLWALAGLPLGVYNIVEDFNVALKIQPQILTVLSLITWSQCRYYGNKWPLWKCGVVVTTSAVALGGIEFGLVSALFAAQRRNVQWPITFMAVLSASLLSAGVLRHYWDIYKERTVRGISFIFVAIDAAGDLTSLLSVFFQSRLDILGIVIYGSELVLWLGILACGGYYNFMPWLSQKRRRRRDPSYSEGVDEQSGQTTGNDPLDLSRSSSTVFRTASSRSDLPDASVQSIRLRAVPVV
ncbi:putative PQ loop repeat protein [Seiridium cardinale]